MSPTEMAGLSLVRSMALLRAWWGSAKNRGFIPEFVLDVDVLLATDGGATTAISAKES